MRLATILVIVPLAALVSCAGWEVRPESAIIMAPADQVWNTTLDLLRERDFKTDLQDNAKRDVRATRDIILRVVYDRATPTTTQKAQHRIDLSVRSGGEDRSVVEVVYRVDRLVEEERAFRFLRDLRDRIAIQAGGAAPSPPRR
ncbi:MAG: hypothetical protein HYY12_01085 [Candidatus Methylomirabilis oxyfera]|nr:hypothetical protein [Candidatus Methylomirabilis oxyfera]